MPRSFLVRYHLNNAKTGRWSHEGEDEDSIFSESDQSASHDNSEITARKSKRRRVQDKAEFTYEEEEDISLDSGHDKNYCEDEKSIASIADDSVEDPALDIVPYLLFVKMQREDASEVADALTPLQS